jgi:hypothetical protein
LPPACSLGCFPASQLPLPAVLSQALRFEANGSYEYGIEACNKVSEFRRGRAVIGLQNKGYTILAWVGVALLALALLVVAARSNWFGAALLLLFIAASIAFILAEDRLPSLFNLLFVVAAILNAAGWVWSLYGKIPGYDEFTHFFTSFAGTLSLGFLTFYAVRTHFQDHRLHFMLVIASFGITLGAFWEIFEWALLKELPNPVFDMIMDSLGAIAAGVAAAWALDAESPREARSEKARGA